MKSAVSNSDMIKRAVRTSELRVNELFVRYSEMPGNRGNLLILHGWSHSKDRWLGIAQQLSNDLRIVIPDLPGFGDSDKPHVSYALDFFTLTITKFCEAAAIPLDQTTCLLGHSLGAAICIKLASTFRVKKVVLVDPPLYPIRLGRLARILGLLAPIIYGLGRQSRFLTRQFAKRTVSDARFVDELMIADARKPTLYSATASLKTMGSEDLEADLLKCDAPILLLYGDKDRIVNPEQYAFLNSVGFQHISVRSISGAGHTPFIERPDMFLSHVKAFLSA